MMRRAIVLLPFFIFFGSWSVLTAAGAVLATTSSGQQALRTFTGWLPENVAAHIGSPTYWLLLPFAVVPATGWVGYRLARSAVPSASAEVSTPMLLLTSATGFAYCFWTLYSIGYWVPGLLFEELDYSAFIARRVAIIESAGFLFYAVIYAILPMCSALFLAKLLKRWSWPDFAGLMCTFAACYYLTFAIYMKLPLVIYFGTLGLAVIFSRRGWLLLPVIAVAAVGTFLSLQSLIGGVRRRGPAFIGTGIAVSLLAYYFTQAPFLGPVTYSYGFAFFVFPAVISARQIILGVDVDRRKRTSAPRSA